VNGLDEQTLKDVTLSSGWWRQIAIRIAYSNFLSTCRSAKDSILHQHAREYDRAVQASFFLREPLDRVKRLYSAYQQAPKLTGSFVGELSSTSGSGKQVWNDLHSTSNRLWLQYVELLEHRGRIAIVKNALDYLCQPDVHEALQRGEWPPELVDLPASFQSGVEKLAKLTTFRRVSTLYQQFIDLLGGWYVDGTEDFRLLSELCGVPEGEVPVALALFDTFFPTADSWYRPLDGIRILKLVPAFMRGAGCFLRKRLRRIEHYEDLVPHPYGSRHVRDWHNALVATLEPYLGVQEPEPPTAAVGR
jgi:hypothetical protein